MDYKTALHTFKSTQEFQSIKKKLLEEKPSIPRWDYQKDNVDEMKHLSSMIQGYELALRKLGITE